MCRLVGTEKGQYTHSLPHTARPTGVQVSCKKKEKKTQTRKEENPGILSVAANLWLLQTLSPAAHYVYLYGVRHYLCLEREKEKKEAAKGGVKR